MKANRIADSSPRALVVWSVSCAFAGCLLLNGCGEPAGKPQLDVSRATSGDSPEPIRSVTATDVSDSKESPTVQTPPKEDSTERSPETSLVDLLLSEEDQEVLRSGERDKTMEEPAPEIDDSRVTGSGIRKLEGRFVTIYTDLPSRFAVDEIPKVFDAAVPLWCKYLGVPLAKAEGWKMTGYVILSKERHRQAGLFPANLPEFLHGFQRGREFWIYDQESDYYRRHLVLHEGVHGFMVAMLGGSGPPWYREGIAEFLATHRWKDRKLRLGYMPKSRDEVPYWGRIKIIKDEFANDRGMMLREVMRYEQSAHLRLEPYAWCWAAVAFLDNHPVYRNRFRQLSRNVTDTTAFFSRDFESQFADRLRELDEEWQLFIVNMDYGFDFGRNRVSYAPGIREVGNEGRSFTLATDRGWQSTGFRMKAGTTYRILAKGRFQLRQQPEWWSEPGGITLRYIGNYPIGMLMGNIRLDVAQPGLSNLANPIPIGLNRRIVAAGDGTLYLKINEHPGELADNKVGQVVVKVMEYHGEDGVETSESEQLEGPG